MVEDTKQQFRKLVRKRLSEYSELALKERSERIWQKLENHPKFLLSQKIMIYYSIGAEVYTHSFIQQWWGVKKFILPCVDGKDLVLREFEGVDNMKSTTNFGIKEPIAEVYSGTIDLVIVPGLAFDKKNNRLGRGKGYYDRFLINTKAYKIGICFDFQFFDAIPAYNDDIRMDEVVFG